MIEVKELIVSNKDESEYRCRIKFVNGVVVQCLLQTSELLAGLKGEAGRSVDAAEMRDGHLILQMSDGTEIDAGELQIDAPDTAERISYTPCEWTIAANVQAAIDELYATLNYAPPSIKSYTMTPSTTTYEKGQVVESIIFAWVLSKEVAEQVWAGEVLDASVRSARATNVRTNSSWTLKVKDAEGAEASSSKSVSFVWAKYYGASSEPSEYTAAWIKSLGSKNLTGSKAGTVTVAAGVGQYIYICMPTSFGTPTFSVGGFDGGFTKVATISDFVNAYGQGTPYDVYKSDNPNLGTTSVVIK